MKKAKEFVRGVVNGASIHHLSSSLTAAREKLRNIPDCVRSGYYIFAVSKTRRLLDFSRIGLIKAHPHTPPRVRGRDNFFNGKINFGGYDFRPGNYPSVLEAAPM